MNILFYLIILIIGVFLGYRNTLPKILTKHIGAIQNACLLLLLFLMGVKIGLDKEVLVSFATIGFQATILAIFSIFFSVLGVKLVAKWITSKKAENEV